MAKLSDVCNIQAGGTPSRSCVEYWKDGNIPWVKISDLKGKNLSKTEEKITELGLEKSSAKLFPKGTILYSIFATLGEVAILGIDATTNQAIAGLQLTDDSVLPDYLYYFLVSKKDFVNNIGRGVAQNNINLKILRDMAITIPSKEEQKDIILRLNTINQSIEWRKQQLSKLDELVKARFVEMFGDPKNNDKNWSMKTFGDICTVRQGLQIPISKRLTQYEDDCYEYITVAYLHGSKEREYIKNPKSTVMCTKDDILMTRTGNTGMVVTDVDGVFHNNFFLIDFDRTKYNKRFLVEYLNLNLIQSEIIKRAGTSTIPDLNHGQFYAISIYEPPIELQTGFATFVEQIGKAKFEVQQSLEKLETLKKSLMQQYFG